MVVTASRLHAVKTRQAFDRYLAEKGYGDLGVLVAFSGGVEDPDDPTTKEKPWTEPEMNRDPVTGKTLPETRLREAFDTDRYQILIVAEKYQTGFDQKKLVAMYVDRRLSGIQAVQTLSRLNRTMPGKEHTFVLDFVNEREEILESFQPFYEATTVEENIDPHRLYELRNEVLAFRILRESELAHFADLFFAAGVEVDRKDSERLQGAIDPALDRFRALDEEDQEKFRNRLGAFVRLYAFLAQVVPFSDVDLERLYVFGKALLRQISIDGEPIEDVSLGEDVALRYYRLQKQAEGAIELAPGGEGALRGPADAGTRTAEEEDAALSTLIDRMNERFGTEWDAQDLVDAVEEQMVADGAIRAAAVANDEANFGYVFDPAVAKAFVERHGSHGEFINDLFSEEEFLKAVTGAMRRSVYRRIREQVAEG